MKVTNFRMKYSAVILSSALGIMGTSLTASATSLYSITEIPTSGIDTSQSFDVVKITDNGQVLVSGSTLVDATSSTYKGSAFVWQNGQTRYLEFPVDPDSISPVGSYQLYDINEAGTVIGRVGLYDVKSGGVSYYGNYGFSWNGGKIDLNGGPRGLDSPFIPPDLYKLNQRGQFLDVVYEGSASYNLYLSGEKGDPGQSIFPINDSFASFPRNRILNHKGQLAVTYTFDQAAPETFFWDRGNAVPIIAPGSDNWITSLADMNDSAEVIGSFTNSNNETRSFLWKTGATIDLGDLGGNYTSVLNISETGDIIGNSTTSSGEERGFIWRNGVMTDLGTLGGTGSYVNQINAAGQVYGCSTTASGASNAFVWTSGIIKDTGISCEGSNRYVSFNDSGQLVSISGDSASRFSYSFYDGNTTFSTTDIETILGENSGWDITNITGLNQKGQIIGTGLFNERISAFVITPNTEPVPEPSTIIGSTLALGTIFLANYRRRRR